MMNWEGKEEPGTTNKGPNRIDYEKLNEAFIKEQEQFLFNNKSENIANVLRKAIIHMELPPETRINVSKLSRSLDVSRTPVNDALAALVQEGLIVSGEDSNVSVSKMNISNLLAICDARAAIEGGAAYLAASFISTPALEHLKELSQRYMDSVLSENPAKFHEHAFLDDEFHMTLVKASENPYLIKAYLVLRTQLLRYRFSLSEINSQVNVVSVMEMSANTHWGIYNALNLRMATTAKSEAERDSKNMHSIFTTLLK